MDHGGLFMQSARAGRSEAATDRAGVIARTVTASIVEQRLPPGLKLSEEDLAAVFGVSRTIVRAALRSLAKDRVIVLLPNRGAFVASPGVEEARQVFEARRVVEAALIREAAARATPADIDTAARHLAEEGRALAAGDRPAAIRLSGDFHLLLASLARQDVLFDFLRELVSRTALVIALYGTTKASSCGTNEHADLLAAVERCDGDRAAALMLQHLRHVEADLDLAPKPARTTDLSSLREALSSPR
jgi:DNA-binding GntR family transcriptional regulator